MPMTGSEVPNISNLPTSKLVKKSNQKTNDSIKHILSSKSGFYFLGLDLQPCFTLDNTKHGIKMSNKTIK